VEGHSLEINSVAWNRAVGTLLLTGSSDNVSLLENYLSESLSLTVMAYSDNRHVGYTET
jgi:hypothetical protein